MMDNSVDKSLVAQSEANQTQEDPSPAMAFDLTSPPSNKIIPPVIFHSTPILTHYHHQSQSHSFTFGHMPEETSKDTTKELIDNDVQCGSVGSKLDLEERGDFHRMNRSQPIRHHDLSMSLMELESLDSSQLRCALEESLLENSNLRCELVEKNRQLRNTRMKVKVLLDLENDGRSQDANISGDSLEERSFDTGASLGLAAKMKNVGVNVNTVSPTIDTTSPIDVDTEPINILPANTFVFIREITSRIEVHQVREKMIEGIHISNQVVVGGLSGLTAAYLLKNFGKAALIALSGGVGLLAVATHKGFVEINWNELFEEIQRRRYLNEELTMAPDHNKMTPTEARWKKWVKDHSPTVAGFVSGFLYSVL